MSYSNRQLPRWQPRWTRPVQFETPLSMTGALLDDGRGLLMWINGGQVRQGFVDSPRNWAQDATCLSATTVPIVDFTAYSMCCYRVGSGLYCTVNDSNSGNGRLRVFKANSASNPTSWSLHGVVNSTTHSDGSFFRPQVYKTGIPYVSGSTWTMLALTDHVTFSGTHGDRSFAFQSTDGGVNWSVAGAIAHSGLSEQGSDVFHVGRDPGSSTLHGLMGRVGGSGLTSHWRSSANGGASWSTTYSGDTIGGFPDDKPFMDDGSFMYGWKGNTTGIVRFNDPVNDPRDTLVLSDGISFISSKKHVCDGGVDSGVGLVMFNSDRVLAIGGGWVVGAVSLA